MDYSPSERLTEAPPPWSPERTACDAAEVPWLPVCARFIRRAQSGGELLADDATADVEADVEADAAASVPAELPSPVAARLPPPSKLLLRLPAARRSGLITVSAPLARPLVATPDAPPAR